MCSRRAFSVLTDVVEKVGATLTTRNNRIAQAGFLNRSCAFAARLESILLEDPLKIFFRQYRPIGDNAAPFARQGIIRKFRLVLQIAPLENEFGEIDNGCAKLSKVHAIDARLRGDDITF